MVKVSGRRRCAASVQLLLLLAAVSAVSSGASNAETALTGRRTGGPQDAPLPTAVPEPVTNGCPKAEQQGLERRLKERAQARWDAVIGRDFAKAYAFETPEFRKQHTSVDYASHFGQMVDWHVVQIGNIRYNDCRDAIVRVIVDASFPLGSGEARTKVGIDDHWVYDGREWWRLDTDSPLSPTTKPEPNPESSPAR